MKLKDLTKEQRVSIEADEICKLYLKELLILNETKFYNLDTHKRLYLGEIKRTIKRIDDEIEFIQNAKNGDDFYAHKLSERFRNLKQQKNLYELMETLE